MDNHPINESLSGYNWKCRGTQDESSKVFQSIAGNTDVYNVM